VISLEAECRAAIGQPFVWQACAVELQVLADIATPHLAALPPGPMSTEPDDLDPCCCPTLKRRSPFRAHADPGSADSDPLDVDERSKS
jgi:hypothetical protein